MLTTIVRTVILYIFLTLCMRLMGKRQIGQLQPAEFVITILISEIVSMPIEDPSLPLLNSFISVCILVSFEIIISVIALKNERFRKSVQGSAVIIIKKGKLDVQKLRALRFSVDDVLEALRKKDVFDIGDVEYAIAETDGSLSVMLKPAKQNPTNKDMGVKAAKAELPCVAVSDGKVITEPLLGVHINKTDVGKLLSSKGLTADKVMLMTVTESGKVNIIKKEDK